MRTFTRRTITQSIAHAPNATTPSSSSKQLASRAFATSALLLTTTMSSSSNAAYTQGDRYLNGLPLYTADNQNHLEHALPQATRDMHDQTVAMGNNTYIDPASGYTVFCRKQHIERGKCCGSGCRHCPYGWANVPAHRKPKPPAGFNPNIPAASTPAATAAAPVAPSTATCVPDVEDVVPSSAATSTGPSAPKKSRVYTRTGDKGKSSLFTGERRSKTDVVFDALGTVDELMSCIGVAKEYLRVQQREQEEKLGVIKGNAIVVGTTAGDGQNLSGEDLTPEQAQQLTRQIGKLISVEGLEHIQQLLMDVGTIIATPVGSDRYTEKAKEKLDAYEPSEWVKDLEKQIDVADSFLPPITVFILPGGGLTSAHLHLARSTCRRAERCMLLLQEQYGDDYNELLTFACKFVNRLSDYLFIAGRAVALHADVHRSEANGGIPKKGTA